MISTNSDSIIIEDVYDPALFTITNFHSDEQSNINPKKRCRWTEGVFNIVPKHKVKNICIEFYSNVAKKLIVFIDNPIKSIKYERQLDINEYVLYIPMYDNDNLTCYTETTVPYQQGDNRKLGLYVRNIFISDVGYDNINLFLSKDFKEELDKIKALDNILETPITDQHANVNICNIDYSSTNLHFNSALFKLHDKKYLLTRKSNYVIKQVHTNTLNLYEFDSMNKIDLSIKDEVEYEQYEDPRVLTHDDKLYVSCANYTHDNGRLIHQKILVFDNKFEHIDNIHPKYGFNGKTIQENTGQEKNWTYFVYENRLMCIYKMFPHTVVEFDWSGNMIAEYKTYFDICGIWKYGECRGGSNPVFKNGYYYSFFHSSMLWKDWKRRYFMGYYKFESKPPFRIIEISQRPILWGNESDQRLRPNTSPLVVFPCGAVLEDDKFLVSFGFNDEKTGTILI